MYSSVLLMYCIYSNDSIASLEAILSTADTKQYPSLYDVDSLKADHDSRIILLKLTN